MSFISFLSKTLESAAQVTRENFGKVKGSTKENDNNQVLTATDLEVGKLIISEIKQDYPEHNIIDEESGVIDNNSDFTWVIDPIDGTSNFANGVPTYGIIVGLLEKNVPVAGGVALPEFSRIITAEKGKGSFDGEKRLQVSIETELRNVLVAYGIDSDQDSQKTLDQGKVIAEIVQRIRNIRSSNSVFDSVMVAQGSYGALLNKTSKIWDNVGQQIIIEEAGGIYTDYFGNKIDYSDPLRKASTIFTCCFGAPQIHKQIQEVINETWR